MIWFCWFLKMIYSYVVGGIMASLFGLVVLYNSRKKRKEMGDLMGRVRNECLKNSGHEGCSQEITAIIVGPGVAGLLLLTLLAR